MDQPRHIPRITSNELARIIKSDKKPWQDYLIVDVRDSDWRGGNIKGSYNLPSLKFSSGVDQLVSKTQGVPMVIFHCKYSQERGPNAAGVIFSRLIAELQELNHRRQLYDARRSLQEAEEYQNQQVYVLQGGFNFFASSFKDDPLLVENWDENVIIW